MIRYFQFVLKLVAVNSCIRDLEHISFALRAYPRAKHSRQRKRILDVAKPLNWSSVSDCRVKRQTFPRKTQKKSMFENHIALHQEDTDEMGKYDTIRRQGGVQNSNEDIPARIVLI